MLQNIEKTAPVSITRPNNTTSYSIGQVINGSGSTAMIPINLNCKDSQNAWLIGGQVVDSVSQSTLAFDCLLFSTPLSIPADGVAFTLADQDMANYYLGRLSFTTFKAYSGMSVSDATTASGKPVAITPNTQAVYAVFVATSAYSPSANENISIRLDYQQIN